MEALDTVSGVMNNPYVTATMTLFVILYGALARPDLPDFVMNLFDNPIFRLVVLFLIGFISVRNTQVALIVALAFTITMNLVSERKMVEGFMAYQ